MSSIPGHGHGSASVRRLEEAGHWLMRLQEDALSEQDLQEWLDWCKAAPDNVAAFEKVQSLWQNIPADRPDADQLDVPKRTGLLQRLPTAAGIAAVSVLFSLLPSSDADVALVSVPTRIEAPARVNETSILPDGSQVALGAGASVTLDFTPDVRSLEMRDGMAFFRVKPDKSRPFVVRAGAMNVTAIGTAFDVRRNGERVVVTVEEGIVEIDHGERGTLRASAGYQLTYDGAGREMRLAPVDTTSELSWRDGRLVYDGTPFAVVVADVSRYASRRIMLHPSLSSLRFTGTVSTDSIETWIEALPHALPVTVTRDAQGTFISPRTAPILHAGVTEATY